MESEALIRMKRILIIIGKLYIGGAERIGRDIGYFADKRKYEVHYLVFGDDIGAYEQELSDSGCIIHHMDSPSTNYFAYYRNLIQLLELNHIDVIHSHTMFSSGWAMLAGRVCGVPIRIAHSHTIRGPEKRGLLKSVYEQIMRKVVIHNATSLVACGKGAGEWFYGAKVFEARGQLIYNGIGLKAFTFCEEARKKVRTLHNLDNSFVIGHVGHFAAVKNQLFLINLMPNILKKKPNAVLLLLGEGDDRVLLESKIQELNLQASVIMTGNVSNVGEYMSAMDVFVFPSLYEGMPLAMVEAQTNGLPCLISERVPKDIHLTNLVKALPIENADTDWVQAILEAKRKDSAVYGQLMYEKGFDTSGMLNRIYKLYEGE